MSDGLNRATLLGNLGADPELRVTGSGKSVCRMRLATSYSYLPEGRSERETFTEWHTISLWGKRGEAMAKLLHKGDRVYIEGRLQTTKYEKDGVDHYSTEIVAMNVVLCGGKGAGGGKPGDAHRPGKEPTRDEPPPGADDDIPF